MGRNKQTGTIDTTTTLPTWAVEAMVALGESATVKQTPEQVLETVLRQGIKAIEKRRKETTKNRIERAEEILRAAGKIA